MLFGRNTLALLRAVLCHTDGALRLVSDVLTLARPASGQPPDKRGGEKSSVDELTAARGANASRAGSMLRSVETHSSTGRFVRTTLTRLQTENGSSQKILLTTPHSLT